MILRSSRMPHKRENSRELTAHDCHPRSRYFQLFSSRPFSSYDIRLTQPPHPASQSSRLRLPQQPVPSSQHLLIFNGAILTPHNASGNGDDAQTYPYDFRDIHGFPPPYPSIFHLYFSSESPSQPPLWLARISVFRFLFSCPTLLPYHIYTPLELAANLHDFFYSPFSNRRHSPHSRNSQTPLWLARIPIFRFLFSCPTLLPYHIYTPLELAANLLQLYPHLFSIPPRNPHSFPVYTQ